MAFGHEETGEAEVGRIGEGGLSFGDLQKAFGDGLAGGEKDVGSGGGQERTDGVIGGIEE